MSKLNKEKQSQNFSKSINRLGRITSIIALIAMFLVPYGTAYYFGVELSLVEGFAAASSLLAIFIPMAVVENVSYYPILGSGGMYLSSITGNITNLKLPAVVTGQQIAGVEPGTDEGDVISILAVGISSLVTILILFISMFFIGQWLIPILNHPVLKPGFDNITPALLGAITVPQVIQNKKLSITPIALALAAFFLIGPNQFVSAQSYVLLLIMILSVLVAYLLFKMNLLDQ